ncbi:MAG: SPASM domain-containing protein [Eubacteriales bacterium]|nr:SPASM domain-containing protein [Eubacteriales bacterium]
MSESIVFPIPPRQARPKRLIDQAFSFESFFNPQTGEYLRSGILDASGHDTGIDPFMASFPHLLDVGVMGHCEHGLSGQCGLAGNRCYQSGEQINEPNMALSDFSEIVNQCRGKVFQFALGGRGDPDQHEHFAEILGRCRDNGIIPNLTTSGFRMTTQQANLIGQHCGAVAVSWYRRDYTEQAVAKLLQANARVNIHFVLSPESIDEAIDLLANERVPAGINRIVFLLFKPIGQGQASDLLSFDQRTRYFFSLMDTPYGLQKSGFDSCSAPGVLNCTQQVDPACFDSCEAGRYSAYIAPDMHMVPCSFDQAHTWQVSLRSHTILQAWNSPEFSRFRQFFQSACPQCTQRLLCLGGCPIIPEITLCDNPRRAIIR